MPQVRRVGIRKVTSPSRTSLVRDCQTWTTSASSVLRALTSWTSQPSQSSTVKVSVVRAAALRSSGWAWGWAWAGAAASEPARRAVLVSAAARVRAVVRWVISVSP
jgi:hypothetical protein